MGQESIANDQACTTAVRVRVESARAQNAYTKIAMGPELRLNTSGLIGSVGTAKQPGDSPGDPGIGYA